jgi:hypothetical protein
MDTLDQILGSPVTNPLNKEGDKKDILDEILPRVSTEVKTAAPKVIAPPIAAVRDIQGQAASDEANYELSQVKPKSTLQQAGEYALSIPVDYGETVKKKFKEGTDLYSQGFEDIRSTGGTAQGLAKIGLGGLSAAISPYSALIEEGVEKPLTKLTGSKEFGEKAGLLLGSGLPVAKTGQAAVAAVPTNKAVKAIVDTIGKDNLPTVIQELKSNDRLSVMDIVPATRQMSQKLITTEGTHQNKFERFVRDRMESGKAATSDIYDASMGVPVNIVEKVDSLKKAARDVGKNEIEPAIAGSGFVDISNVINNIDSKLKPGVNSVITAGQPLPLGDVEKTLSSVRKFIMDENSVRTDPKGLHDLQASIRAEADNLLNSQTPLDRKQGHALMKVRNDIVDAIDKASGGKYKPALAKYKDEMEIQNAFQMGQLVTRNKLGRLEDSPEFWDKWVKGASKEELEAAREGARLAVQHQIEGFKAGARKGQDIVESEFNKEKLSALFGKDEIERMTKRLKDERNIAITNQQLIGNSQTAMRMKADKRVDLPVEKPAGLGPFLAPAAEIAVSGMSGIPGAGIAVLGAQLANKGKYKYVDLPLAEKKNERITDLLTATGPKRDELIKILESHVPKPKQSMLRNFALPVLPP